MDATVHESFSGINTLFIDGLPRQINNLCMSEHHETAADRLFALLDERRIPAADFAAEIKESAQTVGNWRARGNVPAQKTAKVADALGVRRKWLETGDGERDRLPRVAAEQQGLVAEYALRMVLIERIIRASATELAAVSRTLTAPVTAAVDGSRDKAGPPAPAA